MARTSADLRALPRVFGRPLAFDCECPACGRVYVVRLAGGARRRSLRRGAEDPWNVRSSTLTCWDCGRVWIVGLAMWEPSRNVRRPALPRDQVPNRDQLQQLRDLRQQGGAILAGTVETDNQTRPIRTNLAPECTCARLDRPLQHLRKHDPQCPIHGPQSEE